MHVDKHLHVTNNAKNGKQQTHVQCTRQDKITVSYHKNWAWQKSEH